MLKFNSPEAIAKRVLSRWGDPIENFWDAIKKGPPDACWEWMKCRNSNGYGHRSWNGKLTKAHRISWILTHGEIPEGMKVLHKCDNPPCCNPDHLFLGTMKENTADMVKKGRRIGNRQGEQTVGAKLTNESVMEIRRLHENGSTRRFLARTFSVDQNTIHAVVTRHTWRHI